MVSFLANRKWTIATMVVWVIAGLILYGCGTAAMPGVSTVLTPGGYADPQPETWIPALAPQPTDPRAPVPQSTEEPPTEESPTATDVTSAVDAGGEVSITLQGSDAETCELTFTTTDPSNGTLSAITDQSCQSGSPNSDTAVLTYTHDGGDASSDSFTYEVCDESGSCATATVGITIHPTEEPPTEEPPTAQDVSATTDAGSETSITLQGSDAETCELTFTTTDPSNGTLSSITGESCQSGSPNADTAELTYTHDGSDTTSDSFTYQVCDEAGSCATAAVSITITPPYESFVCPEPIVTLNPSSGNYGTSFTIQGEEWLPGGTVAISVISPNQPIAEVRDELLVPDSGKWETSASADFLDPFPGVHQLLFSEDRDTCELRATRTFTVDEPTISLKGHYAPGDVVTVQGSGWPNFAVVSIQFPPGHEVVRVHDFGNKGNFEATFTLPSDAEIGEHKVTAVAVNSPGLGFQAETIFRVIGEEQSYSLTASPSTAAFGGTITVNWTAPADHADTDWIALYKSGNNNDTYITFQRPTPGATSGSLTFTAPYAADPSTAGDYEFRYLLQDGFTDVAQSNTVTLGDGYSLAGSTSTAAPGDTITVTWQAPAGHPGGDWIGLFLAADSNQTYQLFQYVPQGETSGSLDFAVPATAPAGDYEFRYLPHDSYISVATVGITVTGEATPALTADAGPDQTVPGPSPVDVQFDGSGSTGDIVSYQWHDYDEEGAVLAEGVAPVITVDFGQDPQPGTQRIFTLVVADSQGNTAQDTVTITLGETPPEAEQTTITIPGTQPWTDTGLDLTVGASVEITASGTIKVAPSDPGKTPAGEPACVGPAGRKIDPNAETWLTPGLTCWSLVGRIGEDGVPFQIGTSVSFSGEPAGRLYLGVNDEKGRFGNNSGSWTVNITVGGATGGESSPPFNPKVRILRFYESGYDVVPREQRVYAERFARETTRYVNWELNLEHPAPGRRVDFQITAVYYRWNEAGSVAFWEEFDRRTLDTYVEGDWTWSSHGYGYGFDDPGNWAIGDYRVETIFEGQVIAGYVFAIY